jgi:hypothetical protein
VAARRGAARRKLSSSFNAEDIDMKSNDGFVLDLAIIAVLFYISSCVVSRESDR